ncbi:MAG TPA: sigma-70 family RNA polymerase sigma factor [Candidatus Binataceae bacterium]|jgi:RNA polymerase sigma-70 factor (ECF subfamily)|nr:sigma-70 family RNA polymerase sigma factor [Candidatus Binataceae bacterium]
MSRSAATGPARRELFDREALPHLDHLYTVAMHLAHNRNDAEDLVQETMLRALRFFEQFTPGTNCRAWLLTILYNVFRNRYRQSANAERVTATEEEFEDRVEQMGLRADAPANDPQTAVLDRLMESEVQAALDSLPEDFRIVLLMVDIQELRYEEAAAVLDIPLGTVRSRISRARGMLKKALEGFARARGYIRS